VTLYGFSLGLTHRNEMKVTAEMQQARQEAESYLAELVRLQRNASATQLLLISSLSRSGVLNKRMYDEGVLQLEKIVRAQQQTIRVAMKVTDIDPPRSWTFDDLHEEYSRQHERLVSLRLGFQVLRDDSQRFLDSLEIKTTGQQQNMRL
jgi:hypothetical protein